MNFLKKVPVYLLGIIFVVFSIQFFVMVFSHSAMPPMSPMAQTYMTLLFTSGYVWVVKVLELVIGIMLLIPRVQKLALILIAPIVLNIFLSEILIIQPPFGEMIPAFLVLILNVIAIYQRRASYMPIVQN